MKVLCAVKEAGCKRPPIQSLYKVNDWLEVGFGALLGRGRDCFMGIRISVGMMKTF